MAKMGRPLKEIDWAGYSDSDALEFAKTVVRDVWGSDQVPTFIDPIKQVKKMLRLLPNTERKIWHGTVLYPKKKHSINSRLESAVREWVRKYKPTDQNHWEFCGFKIEELKTHIECQFESWMSWDNWGDWHVDHIIPRSRYLKPYQREAVFGLSNLRPIDRIKNMKKGGTLCG